MTPNNTQTRLQQSTCKHPYWPSHHSWDGDRAERAFDSHWFSCICKHAVTIKTVSFTVLLI